MSLFLIALLSGLLVPVVSHITLDKVDLSEQSFSSPAGCVAASCTLKYKWERNDDTNITKVEISGKPDSYDLAGEQSFWLGFGLSTEGSMRDSKLFLCKKIDDFYSVSRFDGFYHGIKSDTEVELDSVEGKFENELMTCAYNIKYEHIPEGNQRLFYGMGPIQDSLVKRHKDNPKTAEGVVMLGSPKSSDSSVRASILFLVLTALMAFL